MTVLKLSQYSTMQFGQDFTRAQFSLIFSILAWEHILTELRRCCSKLKFENLKTDQQLALFWIWNLNWKYFRVQEQHDVRHCTRRVAMSALSCRPCPYRLATSFDGLCSPARLDLLIQPSVAEKFRMQEVAEVDASPESQIIPKQFELRVTTCDFLNLLRSQTASFFLLRIVHDAVRHKQIGNPNIQRTKNNLNKRGWLEIHLKPAKRCLMSRKMRVKSGAWDSWGATHWIVDEYHCVCLIARWASWQNSGEICVPEFHMITPAVNVINQLSFQV